MLAFTSLITHLFRSRTKTLLLNFIPILYPKRIMFYKRGVYNEISLEVYTTFDFQPITCSVTFSSFNSNVLNAR